MPSYCYDRHQCFWPRQAISHSERNYLRFEKAFLNSENEFLHSEEAYHDVVKACNMVSPWLAVPSLNCAKITISQFRTERRDPVFWLGG